MANKPENFLPDMFRKEKINPEEFDSWVRYVQEMRYEEEKKYGEELCVRDIKINMSIAYHKVDASNPPNGANAVIDVSTRLRNGGTFHYGFSVKFDSIYPAMETFENYAKFKGTEISEYNDERCKKGRIFYTMLKEITLNNTIPSWWLTAQNVSV